MQKTLVLSVHQLVDFLLRKGDIDNRVYNRSSMQEGTRIHSSYQSEQDSDTYLSEYPLSKTLFVDDVMVTLQGRADGIIKGRNRYIIDEIKSTVEDLKTFRDSQLEWHLGQAKCYAYMFAEEKDQETIGVRLTYIRQGAEKDKLIENYTFYKSELEDFVIGLIEEYIEFYNIIFRHLEDRSESTAQVEFPFDDYRSGQRKLSELVYGVSTKGGRLFVEAPTGIGKTMSTLFPSVKALSFDEQAKIFYLTAKSSGKEAAMHATKLLKEKGLKVYDILITAKEKICFSKGKACNPDECPFARGYYNKIQVVLKYALLNYSTFDYKTIVEIAQENMICPFEMQLDISTFCDIIVCDYNYMFDPMAYLRRYFDTDASHNLALVDEAHNLVDRSRDMYSSAISFNTYKEAKKSIRGMNNRKMQNALRKMGKIYKEFELFDDGETVFEGVPEDVLKILNAVFSGIQEAEKNDHEAGTKETTNLLLEINSFLKIADFFDERFVCYLSKNDDDITLKIYCKDASKFIQAITSSIKSTTFFSATMSPMDYYVETLGGDVIADPCLSLPSPFPPNNLLVMVAPKISIKYKNRDKSYQEVARYIHSFISAKEGNYFVYVPSYEYLDRLLDEISLPNNASMYVQQRDMLDYEKVAFLENFKENPDHTSVGFLVIGGAFSEGIDLVSDRLIGAVVIGVGIPRINFESDQIRDFYNSKELNGYNYAYLNPGMNKVMQAVGRVIRSETDKGAVLLIDERYLQRSYRSLYRQEWKNYKVVTSQEEVLDEVTNFFRK